MEVGVSVGVGVDLGSASPHADATIGATTAETIAGPFSHIARSRQALRHLMLDSQDGFTLAP